MFLRFSQVFNAIIVVLFTVQVFGQDPIRFEEQILPIFEQHCTVCHGAEDASGELRLHSPEEIRRFDVEYLLSPGAPDESALVHRLTLAEEDELRMPKGADPLSKHDIELIRRWIEQGADMALFRPELAMDKSATLSVQPASPEAIHKVRQAGAFVASIFRGSPMLRVSFRYADNPVGESQLLAVSEVSEQVDSLDLAGKIQHAENLAVIAKLKHLKRLNLENTETDDHSLKHLAKLSRLEHLNLYNTKITDNGLRFLRQLKGLRTLDVWKTNVSYDAAMALKKELPELDINLGWNHPRVRAARLSAELERIRMQKADSQRRETEARDQKLDAAKRESELTQELERLTQNESP